MIIFDFASFPDFRPPSETCALRLANITATIFLLGSHYPSMSFETGAGAGAARLLTKAFAKQATLPATNSPTAAQVIPRNFSPYWADTFEPLPWALIRATNSNPITVAIIDAMLTLKDPS